MTQQHSYEFILDYNDLINRMVERRLRKAVFTTASFCYSAWVYSDQPDL